jgi:hypothetical protein
MKFRHTANTGHGTIAMTQLIVITARKLNDSSKLQVFSENGHQTEKYTSRLASEHSSALTFWKKSKPF